MIHVQGCLIILIALGDAIALPNAKNYYINSWPD